MMFTNYHLEEIIDIITDNRQCPGYEPEQYREELESRNVLFESVEELLDDFDLWREQSGILTEKILDANHWSSL